MAPGITIIGLGPGDPDVITRQAWRALELAGEVYLRTERFPGLSDLPGGTKVHTFDHLYEAQGSFEAVYQRMADELMELARRPQGVAYAVPGDPTVGEATVGLVRQAAAREGLTLTMIPGLSFVEPSLNLIGVDALDGLSLADAAELAGRHHPGFPPDRHVLIGQVHSQLVASDVKLTLLNQYAADHRIALIQGAGTAQAQMEWLELYQLDQRQDFDVVTSVYLAPAPPGSSFESFQETVSHLRAPEGCPWDREQTHQTLRQHLLEEAYEALEAIDQDDMAALQEELGDLMLQLVLQTQIATEAGDFQMSDVLRAINDKLVRRHPHVFGDVQVDEVDQVLHNWEALKAAERKAGGRQGSALAGVPATLPALATALEVQSRAARVGFDWPDRSGVLAKIAEEVEEIEQAEGEAVADELGDLLFALVNYARWRQVDPESALRQANSRFRQRFAQVERAAEAGGRQLSKMSIDELEALWQEAKRLVAE